MFVFLYWKCCKFLILKINCNIVLTAESWDTYKYYICGRYLICTVIVVPYSVFAFLLFVFSGGKDKFEQFFSCRKLRPKFYIGTYGTDSRLYVHCTLCSVPVIVVIGICFPNLCVFRWQKRQYSSILYRYIKSGTGPHLF